MKRFTITFAVALLIGLVTPAIQTTTTPTETVTAPETATDFSAYTKGWGDFQAKYQGKFMEQATSMGQDFMPETDYSQYQAQTDAFMKQSTKLQEKFQKQTGTWMGYSDPSSFEGYQTNYASAYLPKLGVSNTQAEVEGEEDALDQTVSLYNSNGYYSYNQVDEFELEEEHAEREYYAREKALRQIQKLSEQALKAKYDTDSAAITANTTLNATEQAAQLAALKLTHDEELTYLKGNLTQQKEDSRFEMKLRLEELRFKQKEAQLNETEKIAQTFISSLPNATQELLKAEQQKERDVLARQKFDAKVKLYLRKYQKSTANHTAEFQTVLTQAATEVGCNSTCVADCVASMADYTNQSTCLDVCVCFYDSTIRVPPAPVANTTNATVEAVPTLVTAVATAILNQTSTQATGFTSFIPQPVLETIATSLNVTKPVEQTVTVTETTPSTTTTITTTTTVETNTTTSTILETPVVTVEAPVTRTLANVVAPKTITVGSTVVETPVTVETPLLTATITESTVNTTLEANATTALFGQNVQTQGNNSATYMAVLVLVFFFMVMTALYVNKDLKKKNKEDNEQYDTLNDYLLLKA